MEKTHPPEQTPPELFIPNKFGSLQVEMVAAARQNELLAYAGKGNLTQLFSLVLDDIPVIVLQNNGISWYEMWHYAVVIGFDIPKQKVTLHSGLTKYYQMDMELFEKTWQRSSHWYLAAVPDNKVNEHFQPLQYVSAVQDLISVNKAFVGINALKTAVLYWPDYWLSYFLLGNHYLSTDTKSAIHWYKKGYKAGKNKAAYLNNYAYALGKVGCVTLAKNMIEKAIRLEPDNKKIIETSSNLSDIKLLDSCQI